MNRCKLSMLKVWECLLQDGHAPKRWSMFIKYRKYKADSERLKNINSNIDDYLGVFLSMDGKGVKYSLLCSEWVCGQWTVGTNTIKWFKVPCNQSQVQRSPARRDGKPSTDSANQVIAERMYFTRMTDYLEILVELYISGGQFSIFTHSAIRRLIVNEGTFAALVQQYKHHYITAVDYQWKHPPWSLYVWSCCWRVWCWCRRRQSESTRIVHVTPAVAGTTTLAPLELLTWGEVVASRGGKTIYYTLTTKRWINFGLFWYYFTRQIQISI